MAAGVGMVCNKRSSHRVPVAAMRARLEGVAVDGEAYHKRWLMMNVVALPFTFALSVVPGPNVFLCGRDTSRAARLNARAACRYYNVYRAWAHWRALAGARVLSEAASPQAAPLGRAILSVSLCPSKSITALLPEDAGEPLREAATAKLCELFRAPEIATAVQRAQAQAAREPPSTNP